MDKHLRSWRKGPAKKRIRIKKRSPEDFARIYGSKERVEWVNTLPCFGAWVAQLTTLGASIGRCEGKIQNCHTATGGTGYKADAETIVAGCHRHHTMFDQRKAPFDQTMVRGLVKRQAAQTEKAWQDRQARGG